MMSQPFFSICIPTYNRAHLLPAALESALAQTDSDFEIVVVDNASTDNTQEVLKRFDDPRIRVMKNATTVSMYANHNVCVEHARAGWVVFLHSDDCLKPSALARYRNEILQDESIEIITSTCEYYQPLWQRLEDKSRFKISSNEGISLLFRYLGLNMPGVCFRRATLGELGGFNEDTVIADHDLYIRAILLKKNITILRDSVIDIGASERTTNKLIESKEWLFMHGYVLAKHMSNPAIYSALKESINGWKPSELSRLMMYVAAGDNRSSLTQLEKLPYPVVTLAKREKTYMHVRIYKLFGHSGHKIFMRLVAYLQSYTRANPAQKAIK